jgi:hypothetical protein
MRGIALISALLWSSAACSEPLLFYNGRLFVQAAVGGVPTEALLDSGAEATVISPSLARQAKLPEGEKIAIKGSGGSAPAEVVEGAEVAALGQTLHPEAVVVTDLSDLSSRLVKRPVAMILGREIFDAARLQIDIAGASVAAVPRDTDPDGVRLPLTGHAGIESVPVEANGIAAEAEFDLGNGSGVLVSRPFANRLHLKTVGHKSGGGLGGALERDIVRIGRLDVAGKTFRNVEAAVDDQPNANDFNIGTSILKNFLITTDFSQRAVWLEERPNG